MNFIMIKDWPQDIGGEPSFSYLENMPAFVPIMFELTVFFAAHLMVITFYLRSRMWPFKKAENPDPRTTDDHFLIKITIVALIAVSFTSCNKKTRPNYEYMPNMYESVAYETYQESDAFANGKEGQLPVEGTISRGYMPFDYAGDTDGYNLAKAELKSPLDST